MRAVSPPGRKAIEDFSKTGDLSVRGRALDKTDLERQYPPRDILPVRAGVEPKPARDQNFL
jgi:hypothetical protein